MSLQYLKNEQCCLYFDFEVFCNVDQSEKILYLLVKKLFAVAKSLSLHHREKSVNVFQELLHDFWTKFRLFFVLQQDL